MVKTTSTAHSVVPAVDMSPLSAHFPLLNNWQTHSRGKRSLFGEQGARVVPEQPEDYTVAPM